MSPQGLLLVLISSVFLRNNFSFLRQWNCLRADTLYSTRTPVCKCCMKYFVCVCVCVCVCVHFMQFVAVYRQAHIYSFHPAHALLASSARSTPSTRHSEYLFPTTTASSPLQASWTAATSTFGSRTSRSRRVRRWGVPAMLASILLMRLESITKTLDSRFAVRPKVSKQSTRTYSVSQYI